MRLTPLLLMLALHTFGQNSDGLRFIQNKGQWSSDIDFHAKVPGGSLGVSPTGFAVLLMDLEELDERHMASHGEINESDGHHDPIDAHYFRINLLGANRQAKPVVAKPLEGHYNYYLSSDSTRWASNVRAFETVLYEDVYEGIDFRVSSVGNNLKYDFIVSPGADPSKIRIEYNGVDALVKSSEDLDIRTVVGSLIEQKPVSYQTIANQRQRVSTAFDVDGSVVSFSFPDGYDSAVELVIDPLLIFSTYSGSSADNWGSTATPGEHGTLYSAGVTRQALGGFFPATTGAFQMSNHGSFDMAIIKYDSAGTRFLYATHLGGNNNDSPESLVVDKNTGDLIVLGISSSTDFPTSTDSFDRTFNSGTLLFNRVLNTEDRWDIVLTRLSPNGDQLIGSTYLGGSGNDGINLPKQSGGPLVVNYGDEMRGDVITDEAGNVYISSVTASNNFPIINGFDQTFNNGTTDGLVVKLRPDLSSIIWSSYIGGSGFDAAYSIKFDNAHNIVIAGGTTSTNFPVTSGSYQTAFKGIVDGWIARVAADGTSIINATFTGTGSFDQVYFVDLNSSGNIFVYGQTAGIMPILPSGVFNNPNSGQFMQKFSADLKQLQISTVFGSGSSNGLVVPNISPTAFLVNDCNNIYMAGWGGFVNSSSETGFWQSNTFGMPITADAHQKVSSGSDFYFIVLNGDATQLVYSTYLGGTSSKTHVDGGTSRFDKYGIVYHAVCAGCGFGNSSGGSTSDFPTTTNAKSRINASSNCNNAAFKFDLSVLRSSFDTNNLALTMPGFNNVCYPDSIVFENQSTGGTTIVWDFDDGTVVTQNNLDPRFVIHQFQQEGQYRVKLKITDLSACSQTDSTTKIINYFEDDIRIGDDGSVCEDHSYQLSATGGADYIWTSDDGSFTSSLASPFVQPDSATTYFVTATDADGCSRTDTINLAVIHNVRALFQTYDLEFGQPGYNNICFPDSLVFKNESMNGESFTWDFGDETTLDQLPEDTVNIARAFEEEGVYLVKLKAVNLSTCNKADSVVRNINYFKDKIQIGDGGTICEGTTFQLTASGGHVYEWRTANQGLFSSQASPVILPEITTEYFVTVTDQNDCIKKDTVHVVVLDSVKLEWRHLLEGNCYSRPSVSVQNLGALSDEVIYRFDFGDGNISEETQAEHFYEEDGTYTLKFSAQKEFCYYEQSTQVPVYVLSVPNVFTPDGSPGFNDNFQIAFGADRIAPADIGLKTTLVVFDRWGKKVYESDNYNNDWNAQDVAGGVYYFQVKVGDYTSCRNWVHIIK